MKNVSLALLLLTFVFGEHVQAQLVDVDEGESELINAEPILEPGSKDDPYRVRVFNNCNVRANGKFFQTERLMVEVWTSRGAVGLVPVEVTDSYLIVQLKLDNREAKSVLIETIPEQFTLVIIAGSDTARFHVDRTVQPVLVKALQESSRFALENVWEFPVNTLYVQFDGIKSDDVKTLTKSFRDAFGGTSAELVALPTGFYPCFPLPNNVIDKTFIGRGKSSFQININARGHIVFFKVIDLKKYDEIAAWLTRGQETGFASEVKK